MTKHLNWIPTVDGGHCEASEVPALGVMVIGSGWEARRIDCLWWGTN